MSEQWSEILGDFKTITAPGIVNLLGKSFYQTILKQKDNLLEDANFDVNNPKENRFHMYETLHMALNPKKKDDKDRYTYVGDKTTTDKKTKKKKTEKDVVQPVKKFANITGEVKNGLVFILNKYIKECHECYLDNKKTFLDESNVLTQICNYAESHMPMPITPVIVKSADVLDIELLIEGNYANCLKQLVEKLRTYFKDKEEKVPEKQLGTIVDAFIKFMKILAVFMTGILYEKRQAVNGVFLFGILRMMNNLLVPHNCKIEDELFDNLKEYIDAKKPKKDEDKDKPKKKKGDEDEDEDEAEEPEEDAEDEEEGESEKKSEKKSVKKTEKKSEKKEESSKKTRGRPKSTKKKDNSPKSSKSDHEDEDDENPDVDSEINRLETESWDDEAEIDN